MISDAPTSKLLKVTVHGATIASTLYAVTTGGAPCDGLLFGDTITTTTQHVRDDDDTATVTESRAVISSALCCASTCSFYDQAGELAEPSLEELGRQQPAPLLGWLSYRPAARATSTTASASSSTAASTAGGAPSSSFAIGSAPSPPSSLRPSMREVAVTSALLQRQAARLGGRQAVLLLLVTSGADHNGATVTWQYRCFQARRSSSTGGLLLEPVHLQTVNLGGHVGQAAYHELAAASGGAGSGTGSGAGSAAVLQQHPVRITFASSPSLQPQPAAVGAGGGGGSTSGSRAPGPGSTGALGPLAASARTQVAAVKQHCESLLGGLQELCGQAVAGEAAAAALRARRDALLAQLARTE